MLHAVNTGAYYPPVDTTWKILTTGTSQLTAGALCIVLCLPTLAIQHILIFFEGVPVFLTIPNEGHKLFDANPSGNNFCF